MSFSDTTKLTVEKYYSQMPAVWFMNQNFYFFLLFEPTRLRI